jgi:hypothetical protein
MEGWLMSFKGKLGILLVILGFASIALPFTREFIIISLFLIIYGTTKIFGELGGKERLRGLLGQGRRVPTVSDKGAASRIDPLLPVRVLKLAESHAGVLTVSVVAMALNVGLDECQIALDDLVRKGAASEDIDFSTGVATYRFPEFLPHTIEGAQPL